LARCASSAALAALPACSFLAPSDRELAGGKTSSRLFTDAALLDGLAPPSMGSGGTSSVAPPGTHVVHPDAGCTGCSTSSGGTATLGAGGESPVGPLLDAGGPDAATLPVPIQGADSGPAVTPPSPGAALEGLRLDIHCGAEVGTTDSCKEVLPSGTTCPGEGYQTSKVVVFGGSPTSQYWVKLRFRGIVEPKVYQGGVADIAGSNGRFYQDGAPGGDPTFNEYGFTVSSPGQSYFLNNWMEGNYVIALDYNEMVLVRGGAKVTLFSYSKLCAQEYDCADLTKAPSCTEKTLAGVTHLKDKGQFVQLDVVSVVIAPSDAKPGLTNAAK
jgi:hypothetical protein